MVPFRRSSARHIIASILFLGCATLALTLLAPEARVTIWLSKYWRSLGAALAALYLLNRFLRVVLPNTKIVAQNPTRSLHQDRPLWPDGVPALSNLAYGSFEWSRAKTLYEAASLPIADAVYRIVAFNGWCSAPLRIGPSELPWLPSVEQFEMWSQRAGRLRNAAYHVGDAGLRKDGSYHMAREKLIANNPGFSEDTYERAISYGYQAAR